MISFGTFQGYWQDFKETLLIKKQHIIHGLHAIITRTLADYEKHLKRVGSGRLLTALGNDRHIHSY
jgi:hypothetical protein